MAEGAEKEKVDRQTVFRKTTEILSKFLNINTNEIKAATRLKEDLGIESVDVLDIALELEREFEIDIGDYEATWVVTIQDMIDLIVKKMGGET